jgi:hypothetical protein
MIDKLRDILSIRAMRTAMEKPATGEGAKFATSRLGRCCSDRQACLDTRAHRD